MQLNVYRQSTATQIPLSFARSNKMTNNREDDDAMALDERIRIVMAAMSGPDRGKQVRLSKIADTSKQVVNHWLTGVTQEMQYETARRISDELGFRIDWLLRGKGPAKKDDPDEAANAPETMALVYVTSEELEMITKYRAAGERGRQFIAMAVKGAPVD
jgi:hypothetical protein